MILFNMVPHALSMTILIAYVTLRYLKTTFPFYYININITFNLAFNSVSIFAYFTLAVIYKVFMYFAQHSFKLFVCFVKILNLLLAKYVASKDQIMCIISFKVLEEMFR